MEKTCTSKKARWPLDKPIVLLVGGGDGMGPLGTTARAIDELGLDLGLVIVCGRNEKLKAHLELGILGEPGVHLWLHARSA